MIPVRASNAQKCPDVCTSRLELLEAIVDRGRESFLAVGAALVEIRDSAAYREAGYATFSVYLAERWPDVSRSTAYNAIAAAEMQTDLDGVDLPASHLLELRRAPLRDRQRIASLSAARDLSVRELRALIRDKQATGEPRRPSVLVDYGPPAAAPAECRLEVGDARTLPFEDGAGHRDRVHGGPCGSAEDCPHPALVLTSPPYNAGITYDADPTGDALPWRDYWHGLILPHFREVYRVLQPGGRFACNLANVLRSDNQRIRSHDVTHNPEPRYVLRGGGLGRRQHAGAGGEAWAQMVDRLLWSTWARLGFLARERFVWIKTTTDSADGDPADTITLSTAWGTFCSPENPVARAVAEPIFVSSKATHKREQPDGAVSDLDPSTYLALTRNAWLVPNQVDRSRHPAPWPRGVPDNLIRLYTWPGDLVVDPFVGSGAAAESAVVLGRRFYGRDQSAVYVHDAQRRAAEASVGGDQ